MRLIKKILLIVLTLVLIIMPTACNNNIEDEDDPTRTRKETITFMHIWPEHAQAIQKIVNQFMAENPNITVEIQQSTASDVTTYLQMQAISKSYPDVFFYWTHQMSDISDLNCALDLTSYVDGWKETFINNGEAWDLAKIDGKYYNVPFRSTGYIIVYNKTLFEELSLEVPTSLEEFENVLETLRKSTANMSFSPLAVSGVAQSTLPQLITALKSFVELQDERYKDEKYQTGLVKDSETDLANEAKVLDKIKYWVEKGYFGYTEGKREATCISDFVNLNAGMVLMNNNNLSLLEDLPEDVEIGFMAIPAPQALDGYTYVYGGFDGFCVSNYTRHKEAAIKFLKYLTSQAVSSEFGNSEMSIMAVDNVTYTDANQQKMKEALKDVGNPLLKQNNVEYSLGTIGEDIDSIKLSYVLGKSNKSALQIVQEANENITKEINSLGYKLYDRTYPYPSNIDLSWLDIK